MKKYIIGLLFLTLLFSCSKEELKQETKKTDYLINVEKIGDFESFGVIKKSGRLDPRETININSLVNARVSEILVKEGDRVSAGQTIVRLTDSGGGYTTMIQNAKNELNSANIRKEEQIIALNKSISDAKIGLDTALKDYELLKKDIENQINELDLKKVSVNLDSDSSVASLNLQRLEQDISKVKLDFENLKVSDDKQKSTFAINLSNNFDTFKKLLDDISYNSDLLLGVSDTNRNANNSFEIYLGAKNSSFKNEANNTLREILTLKNNFQNIDINITTSDYILGQINILKENYDKLNNLVIQIDGVLKNSVSSSTFSQNQIDLYISQYNGYRNTLQQFNSSFTSFADNTKNFYDTYKDRQLSMIKSIESLEKQLEVQKTTSVTTQSEIEIMYERQILQLQDRIENAKIALKRAQSNYDTALLNKEVALSSIDNSINRAQISYNDASINYNKLSILSPVFGTLGNIGVQVGQDVNIGSMIATIGTINTQEITFGVNRDELDLLKEGQKVYVIDKDKKYEAILYSISSIADNNLNYSIRVQLQEQVSNLGNIVKVEIPVEKEILTLPLNILENIDKNTAFAYFLASGKIEKRQLQVGDIIGDSIQILSNLNYDDLIITSNVKNYNENEFILKINN